MRTVEEHVSAVLAGARATPVEDVPLAEASGLVLGADVASRVDLPAFDNSAMDGYAVRLADVAGAAPDEAVTLPVVDDVPAGDGRLVVLQPGTAVRIMTGAPVPAGTRSMTSSVAGSITSMVAELAESVQVPPTYITSRMASSFPGATAGTTRKGE